MFATLTCWYGSTAPVQARWKQPLGGRRHRKLNSGRLGVSRAPSLEVERSAVPANPDRPASAAADTHPPNPNGCTQSEAGTQLAPAKVSCWPT